jgi:hypothetical protein
VVVASRFIPSINEVLATTGLEGTSGTPPFCQPPQCVDLPRPALDQLIKGVAWSHGRRMDDASR